MSMVKRMMEMEEEKRVWAEELLLATGALRECEAHEEVTDNYDGAALAEAQTLARATPFKGMTPDEAAAFLEDALTNYGMECGRCEKIKYE